MTAVSEEFKKYAWFSVQVDQYYSAVRIYARHHEGLREVYQSIPRGSDWPQDLCTNPMSLPAKKFFISAASTFNYMGTTGLFDGAQFPELHDVSTDMINFGFYTCFCFQWTLFETFVKESVLSLADAKAVPEKVAGELKKRERSTARFLSYIHDGHVFGRSPFTTVLTVAGWVPKVETCTLKDLDQIRERRNEFIHAVREKAILSNTEVEKERLYERSMWIMRRFAQNVDQECQNLRNKTTP